MRTRRHLSTVHLDLIDVVLYFSSCRVEGSRRDTIRDRLCAYPESPITIVRITIGTLLRYGAC